MSSWSRSISESISSILFGVVMALVLPERVRFLVLPVPGRLVCPGAVGSFGMGGCGWCRSVYQVAFAGVFLGVGCVFVACDGSKGKAAMVLPSPPLRSSTLFCLPVEIALLVAFGPPARRIPGLGVL